MKPSKQDYSDLRQKLKRLLAQDLGFHKETSPYGLHNFHSFPAKFPPQLPKLFINELTRPNDVVLDPMMGSGTTVIEALLAGRQGIGFDIDPLALRICKAKTTVLTSEDACTAGQKVIEKARHKLEKHPDSLQKKFNSQFDDKTREFIEYWFSPQTIVELMALLGEIEEVEDDATRQFLELIFSAIIITKSGGVSLARDLAHTRPHRVDDKTPRPAIPEFKKRLEKNAKGLLRPFEVTGTANVQFGNSEALPLADDSVDLIVTSPPYASNAIDYMRAHKFSLVWFGYHIKELSELRSKYIGGENTSAVEFVPLPDLSSEIVTKVAHFDKKKGATLHRYYSEITRMLSEARRVLKPGKAAIIVVGSSVMKGVDTRTQDCLGEIGTTIGFKLAGIATRILDRDRRMMPARFGGQRSTQIEERMHEEYVIAFYK
ncbi:MAG: site-specific DNA-methyltransferase [Chloroflexota bacterium]